MRKLVLAWVIACGWFVVQAAAAELSVAGKQELAKLSGVWRLVSSEREGKNEENAPPLSIEIRGDVFLLNEQDIGLRITALEPGVTPCVLDITHNETKRTFEAIYELKGDLWKITANTSVDGAPERPTEFKTVGNAKFVTSVFKRDQ